MLTHSSSALFVKGATARSFSSSAFPYSAQLLSHSISNPLPSPLSDPLMPTLPRSPPQSPAPVLPRRPPLTSKLDALRVQTGQSLSEYQGFERELVCHTGTSFFLTYLNSRLFLSRQYAAFEATSSISNTF